MTISLNIDYVLAIDPGYGTQGLCVINARNGTVPEYKASVTTASIDIHARCKWQINQVLEVIHAYGHNCLLVLEEFHTATSGKVSAESVYRRGWYDGMLREHVMPQVAHAITVHAAKVHQWSEDARVWGQNVNKKGKVSKKWLKPTEAQIRQYIMRKHEWLCLEESQLDARFTRKELRGANSYGKKDSIESANKSLIHATDAMVMAVMGHVCFLPKRNTPILTVKQLEWLHATRDLYDFKKTSCR